jgi:hypothetical protein
MPRCGNEKVAEHRLALGTRDAPRDKQLRRREHRREKEGDDDKRKSLVHNLEGSDVSPRFAAGTAVRFY